DRVVESYELRIQSGDGARRVLFKKLKLPRSIERNCSVSASRFTNIALCCFCARRRRCSWMRCGRRNPGKVYEIAVGFAGKAFDVSGIAERVFLFSRRMAAQAIK